MTTLVPGFYGKLPSHGDFVRRRLSGAFVGLWDSWLQNAIARSKEQLGSQWLDIYLSSPLWRFVFTPGVCGPDMSAGVLMPSVDKAGRYFPLTMVVSLPDPVNPLPLAAEYDDWFSRAESILLTALDDTARFELDVFDRQVESCVLDFQSAPKLPAGSDATDFPAQGKSWHIGIASVDHLGASLRHLHWKQLGRHFNPLSMWWTNGSEHLAPSALLCEGIPPAESFAAMLDGDWGKRQWPSIHLESVSRISAAKATAQVAVPQPPAEVGAPEPEPEAPPPASGQPAVAPQSQPFIPEFDPLEITSPQEDDVVDYESHDESPAVPAPVQEQGVPAAPVVEAPAASLDEVAPTPEKASPEIDPLQAIEVAQPSGTPLDPLEALGLAGSNGDDLGVSGAPASFAGAAIASTQPDVAAVDTPSSADASDVTELPDLPGEVDDRTRPEPARHEVAQVADSGPAFFSASATHAGNQNDFNEDALLERRDVALWAVADGGGGHWIGDVASQAVVSELETVKPSSVLGDLADDVKGKLLQAHRYLQDNLERGDDTNGDRGAAVAVFVATETMSACLSAGPVHVYRRRDGSLERLNPDTGLQGRLIGDASELLVDSRFHDVEVGDWFLLCSRGLYEQLNDADMAQVFSGSSPEEVCENLMSEALSRDARDNVSIVVVHAAPAGVA